MCGRYFIENSVTPLELQEIIDAVNRKTSESEVKTSGEIRPSDTAPVIANNKKMETTVFPMKWGYSLPNGKLVINARSESATEKPMFRDGMNQRRCVVPASYYFEWEYTGNAKTQSSIRPTGADMMYMAGIYRIEQGKPVYTILTRSPADNISFIHDRMPVILPQEFLKDWLNPKYAATELMKEAILSVAYEKTLKGSADGVQMKLF